MKRAVAGEERPGFEVIVLTTTTNSPPNLPLALHQILHVDLKSAEDGTVTSNIYFANEAAANQGRERRARLDIGILCLDF